MIPLPRKTHLEWTKVMERRRLLGTKWKTLISLCPLVFESVKRFKNFVLLSVACLA